MTIAGPGRDTYRKAKRSRVSAIRLVKETLAAQLSLRCTLSHVDTYDFGRIREIHGSEKQVPAIRPDRRPAPFVRCGRCHGQVQAGDSRRRSSGRATVE